MDEVASPLTATTADYQVRILTVAVETGMREQELCTLTWDAGDLTRKQIVLSADTVNVKNNQTRMIPISQVCFDTLIGTPRHPTSRLVFWHGDGEPYKHFSNFWRGIRRRAKLPGFRFHDMRHTFASNFLNNGGSLATISSILGHSSVQVTERYAHLVSSTQHDEMRRIDERRRTTVDIDLAAPQEDTVSIPSREQRIPDLLISEKSGNANENN